LKEEIRQRRKKTGTESWEEEKKWLDRKRENETEETSNIQKFKEREKETRRG